VYLISDHGGQQIVIWTIIWWWKRLGRLAVNKQGSHEFHMERFNLEIFNEIEGKGQYNVEVANRLEALQDWMLRWN
jgi:hypothetical protein